MPKKIASADTHRNKWSALVQWHIIIITQSEIEKTKFRIEMWRQSKLIFKRGIEIKQITRRQTHRYQMRLRRIFMQKIHSRRLQLQARWHMIIFGREIHPKSQVIRNTFTHDNRHIERSLKHNFLVQLPAYSQNLSV